MFREIIDRIRFRDGDYEEKDGKFGDYEPSEYSEDGSALMKNDRYDDYDIGTKSTSEKFLRFPEKDSRTHKIVKVKGQQYHSKLREAANYFKDGHVVYLNMDEANKDATTRVLDFLGGMAYALDGRPEKISNTVYAIVPNGDEIGGDIYEDMEYQIDDMFN